MLLKVVREEDVRYCAVCFDEHGPTFRHVAYADYKAGRTPTPPELVSQFKLIRELLPQLGIRQYSLQGYEADDLLGTLSLQGEGLGVKPLLLTGDRDALQLVDGVTELMFTRKGITDTVRFTPETVRETYGFGPEQVTDWKGMAGDSSDNIPAFPGWGTRPPCACCKSTAPWKTPWPTRRRKRASWGKTANLRRPGPQLQGAGPHPPGRPRGAAPGGMHPGAHAAGRACPGKAPAAQGGRHDRRQGRTRRDPGAGGSRRARVTNRTGARTGGSRRAPGPPALSAPDGTGGASRLGRLPAGPDPRGLSPGPVPGGGLHPGHRRRTMLPPGPGRGSALPRGGPGGGPAGAGPGAAGRAGGGARRKEAPAHPAPSRPAPARELPLGHHAGGLRAQSPGKELRPGGAAGGSPRTPGA